MTGLRPRLAAVAALLAATVPVESVSAEDASAPHLLIAEGETLLHDLPIGSGRRFTLAWIHSVEREAWEETFEIEPDASIELVSTRFKTYGAGVPSDGAATTRIEDGWVVMEGFDRDVDPLAVLVTPKQNYELKWDGGTLDLSNAEKPRILTFRAEPGG